MKDDVVQILKSVPGVRPLFASEIVKCRTHVIPSGDFLSFSGKSTV